MEDVKRVVAIATRCKGKVLLKSGNDFSVNAKSLLGVLWAKKAKKMSWDDLTLEMENDYYKEFERFIID